MPDVFQVPKRCACGAEWTGNTFQAPAENEVLPRIGTCDACLERDEKHLATLTHPIREAPVRDIELSPPQHVGEIA